PSSDLQAIFRVIDISLLDAHIFPIDIQLLGDKHGQHGLDALAHFRVLGDDRDDAIRSNANKSVWRERRGWRRLAKELGLEIDSQKHTAASQGAYAQKRAPTKGHRRSSACHKASSLFARRDRFRGGMQGLSGMRGEGRSFVDGLSDTQISSTAADIAVHRRVDVL